MVKNNKYRFRIQWLKLGYFQWNTDFEIAFGYKLLIADIAEV